MICNSHKVSGRETRENVSSRNDHSATATGAARRTIERTEETNATSGQCTAYRWTRPKQRTRKRRKRKTATVRRCGDALAPLAPDDGQVPRSSTARIIPPVLCDQLKLVR